MVPLDYTPLSTPEKRLALAMIVLVIQDLKLEKEFLPMKDLYIISKNKKINKKNVISAFEYLMSNTTKAVFSFNNCCDYLGFDAKDIRKKIIEKALKNPATLDVYLTWKLKQEN